MRVLVLQNMYPPHHYGGYELLCQAVVERWRSEGHEVEVVVGDHLIAGRDAGPEPGVTRGLRFYWKDFELIRPPPWTRLRWERQNRRLWEAVLDRFRPDIVSVWNHGTMSYALLTEVVARGVPLALVVGDNWLCWGPEFDRWTHMFDPRRRPGRLRQLAGRAVERATGVPTRYPDLGSESVALFASTWLARNVEEQSRFRFDRAFVVPHGIDVDLFPITPRDLSRFRGRIVFVGRVDERKGVYTAVRAMAQLPGMHLEIVGPANDAERARLDALVAELGIADRVTTVAVDAHEVRARYLAADVVLFPSEWGEPFGLVPLEAMASGTPVVATGTGGSADFLRHEHNALLVPIEAPDAIAAAVRRLAADPHLRASLAAAGAETAAAHTVAATAAGLMREHRLEWERAAARRDQ